MQIAGIRTGQVGAEPVTVVVGAHVDRRAEIAAAKRRGDDLRARALHKHQVVRTGGLLHRPWHIHDAEIERDRKLLTVAVEAVVGDERVLDAGQKRVARGRAGARIRAGQCVVDTAAIGRISEIVDKGVVPVAHERSDYADTRAAQIDAIRKALAVERLRPGRVAGVTTGIDLKTAKEFDGVVAGRIRKAEVIAAVIGHQHLGRHRRRRQARRQ